MKAVDLSPFKALTSPIHIRYCEKVCQSILYWSRGPPDLPEILSFRIFSLLPFLVMSSSIQTFG